MVKAPRAASVESISVVLRFVVGEMPFEIVEPSFPQRAERLGPVCDGFDRLGAEPARPALRVTPLCDQTGVLEHPQVLRDGGLRQPERCGEFADRRLAVGKTGEDRPPSRIAEGGEGPIKVNSHFSIYPSRNA